MLITKHPLFFGGQMAPLSKDHHFSLAQIYIPVMSLRSVMQHIQLILKTCSDSHHGRHKDYVISKQHNKNVNVVWGKLNTVPSV